MTTVELAPGAGWLACRSGALLWSPDESRPDALLDAVPRRSRRRVDARPPSPRRWSVRRSTSRRSPSSRGRRPCTSWSWAPSTWRRTRRRSPCSPAPRRARGSSTACRARTMVVVCAGTAPAGGTDVGSGVVRAGGFRLTAATRRCRRARRQPAVPAAPVRPPAEPAPGAVPRAARPCSTSSPAATGWTTASGSARPERCSTSDAGSGARRAGPRSSREGTVTVPGRHCPSGHANPPTQASCRRCGDLSISPRRSSRSPSRSSPTWRATTARPSRSPERSSSGADPILVPPVSRTMPPSDWCSPERPGVVADAPRRPRRRVDDHGHRLRLAPRHRARPARRGAGAPRAVDVARGARRRRTCSSAVRRDPPRGAAAAGDSSPSSP